MYNPLCAGLVYKGEYSGDILLYIQWIYTTVSAHLWTPVGLMDRVAYARACNARTRIMRARSVRMRARSTASCGTRSLQVCERVVVVHTAGVVQRCVLRLYGIMTERSEGMEYSLSASSGYMMLLCTAAGSVCSPSETSIQILYGRAAVGGGSGMHII